MLLRAKLPLCCAVLALLAAPASIAGPVTFSFTGTVIDASASTGVSIGDAVSGSFTFESTTPDALEGDEMLGEYVDALTAYATSVHAAGFSASAPPFGGGLGGNFIRVSVFPGSHQFGAQATFPTDTLECACTIPPNDPGTGLITLLLLDSSGTAFSSDALPVVPPDLDDFDLGQVSVSYGTAEGFQSFTASLDSLTADNCPDWPNANQSDVDDNGIGDACECGDQNGDGTVDVNDILAINAAIFDPSQVTDLCDTNDDQLCDVQDILGANAKIFGSEAYCSRYPTPAP